MPEQQVSILAKLVDGISRPGKRVSSTFKSIRTDIDRVRSAAGPLGAALSGIAASFASISAAQESLDLAETQFNAETRLLAALKGRRAEFERILALSSDLQNQTRTGDEAFIEAAANLVNAGVAASTLDKNLLAAVETAAALPITFEQAQRALGRFAAGRAGELGELIPELQALQEEGRLAAEGVDFLLEKFQGAETALANTEFGKVTQETNAFGDSLEIIGNLLVGLQLRFQQGLNAATAQYVEITSSPEARGFIGVLGEILELVGGIAPQLVSIAAIIGGISLVTFIAPLIVIGTKVTLVLGIITAVGTAIFNLLPPSLRDRIINFFTDLINQVRQFLVDVDEGKTSFEDLFDGIATGGRTTFLRLKSDFFDPTVIFLKDIVTLGEEAFDVLFFEFLIFGGKVAKFLNVDLIKLVRDFTSENLSEDVANALFPSEAELRGVGTGFDIALNVLREKSVAEAEEFKKEIVQNQLEIAEARAESLAEIEKLEIEYVERSQERDSQRREARRQEQLAEVQEQERVQRALALAIAEGEERARQIAADENLEVQELARARELAELERSLGLQLISFREYIDQRRQLELGSLEERLQNETAQITAIEEQIAARREAEGAEADVLDLVNQLVSARLRQQAVEEQIAAGALQIQSLIDQNIVDQSEGLAAEAEAAASSLSERRQEIAALVEAGRLNTAESLALLEEADAAFETQIQSILFLVDTLIQKYPELSAALLEVREEVIGVRDETEQATESVGTFGEGLEDGFTTAAQQASNLNRIGSTIGNSFVTAVGDLARGFVEGEQNFKELAGTFLKQIAVMIIQAIILRTILSALGLGGGVGITGNTGGMATPLGFLHMAGGGRVPGPIGANKDIISAKLMPGEHVIKKPSASYYGYKLMELINNAMIPREFLEMFSGGSSTRTIGKTRFNTGGEVGMTTAAANTDPQRGYIPADDDTIENLLNGGRNAVVRFFGGNSDEIKAALGII